MPEKSGIRFGFTSAKGRAVEAAFDGGAVSTDGGLLLVREVDRKLGLIRGLARRLSDQRQPGKVRHETDAAATRHGAGGWMGRSQRR